MGTKKSDFGVITKVENQEEWDKLMKFNGLVVADIYQEWNGFCKPVISLFNKLYAQINQDGIKFTQVKIDNIRSLQLYKGKCEPTFLFFGGGQLVAVIRGVNAPILKEMCLLKFEEELKISKGEIERIVVRDPGIKRLESADDALAEDLFEFSDIEMTFAIIKPDVIAKGMLSEIIEKIEEEGFDVIRKEIRQLSREEVIIMYSALRKADYMEEIITYMITGKSCVLALECDLQNAVAKLREITGPSDVEKAKKTEPLSLRALYGLSGYRNGIHSAESREEALRSISIAFPDLILRKNTNYEENERAVVVIPVNIYNKHLKIIMEQFADAQLKVVDTIETCLAKVDIMHLYKFIIIQKDLHNERIEEMYGSKFNIILFQHANCLNIVKYMLDLYTPELEETFDYKKMEINELEPPDIIYVSENKAYVIRDINFFFPIEVTFAIIKPDAYEQRDEIIKLIKSAGFMIPIAEDIFLSYDVVEEIYTNVKTMPFYAQHMSNMTSGKCLVMVLSKHNAILDWRDCMGSVNPEEAAEQSPDKLRGIFGSTLIENALHGSSNKVDTMKCINLIFGNVQFDERGNVCGQTLPSDEETFSVKVYVPINIEEVRVNDILKKLCFDKELILHKKQRELPLKMIAKLYSTIKCFESYPNLKCFIVVGGNIIPVIQQEENVAWEKLEKINSAPKFHKNFGMRQDLWTTRFNDNIFKPESKYIIYSFNKEISKPPSIAENVEE